MKKLELKATILQACKTPLGLTAIGKACGFLTTNQNVRACVLELVEDRKLEVIDNSSEPKPAPRTLYRTVNQ